MFIYVFIFSSLALVLTCLLSFLIFVYFFSHPVCNSVRLDLMSTVLYNFDNNQHIDHCILLDCIIKIANLYTP